jgi:hypothetical protein
LGIKSYVWGGFVQDIIEGKILREHGGLDMFMENMDSNIIDLEKYFIKNGYKYKYDNDLQMINIEKDDVRNTLNPIIFKNETAIWKHIGNFGFMCFPKEWLDTEYREFYNVKVLTSGILFEYSVRKIIKYMNPEWTNKIREKDIVANKYYENKILEMNINPKELMEKIWAYNPYWYKDGYNGYEAPVFVEGKDYI